MFFLFDNLERSNFFYFKIKFFKKLQKNANYVAFMEFNEPKTDFSNAIFFENLTRCEIFNSKSDAL